MLKEPPALSPYRAPRNENMKQEQRRLKRSVAKKVRKNAVSKKLIVVIPVHGMDDLKARIGEPFQPMDFRQIIAEAKQKNPENADKAFHEIVRETTSKQLNELLSALHINSNDNNAYQEAFGQLACALLNVGQVVWTPAFRRPPRRALQQEADLYWLVEHFKDREGLSERKSIEKIVSASLFPYRPQRRTRSSSRSGQVAAMAGFDEGKAAQRRDPCPWPAQSIRGHVRGKAWPAGGQASCLRYRTRLRQDW
jgi:hypothetical protein